MSDISEVHQTLAAAQLVLVRRGHYKQRLCLNSDGSGPVCLRGALLTAITGDPRGVKVPAADDKFLRTRPDWRKPGTPDSEMLNACESAMGFSKYGRSDFTDAASWNNRPETTMWDVLDRFKRGLAATAPLAPQPQDGGEPPVEALDRLAGSLADTFPAAWVIESQKSSQDLPAGMR